MAKKKSKKSSNASQSSPYPMEKRVNAGLEEVENGFVVRISGDGISKDRPYQSKTFVAMDRPSALRIASQGFSSMASKVGSKKKSTAKKSSVRKRV